MTDVNNVAEISSNQGFAIAVGIVLILLFSGIVIWIIKQFFKYFEREYTNHRNDMEKMMTEFGKRSEEHEQQMLLLTKVFAKQDRILQYEAEETATTAKVLNELDLIKRNHYAKKKS